MKKINTFWFNYFRPTYFFESISKINLLKLYQEGVRTIISDLDNTLTPHYSNNPIKSSITFINDAKKLGMNFFIFSNNRGKRVQKFINHLNKFCKIDGYISNSKKPFLWKTKKMVKNYKIKLDESIIIGDQFITDIFIANRLHVRSILVFPLLDISSGQLHFIQRIIERYIYKNIKQLDMVVEDKVEEDELL